MNESIGQWASDPGVRKFAAAVLGLLLIYVVVRLVRHGVASRVHHPDSRYRTRKLVSAAGWAAALLLLGGVFSDRFGQLTVALGVAGAGIAFALQEVIASVAGWVAISLGGFYSTGDRVQVGGIAATSSTSVCCARR